MEDIDVTAAVHAYIAAFERSLRSDDEEVLDTRRKALCEMLSEIADRICAK